MFHSAAFSCAGSCRLFAHHARAAASVSRQCPGTESVGWGFTVSPVSQINSDQPRSTRWGDYFWWCTAWSHNRKCPRSSSFLPAWMPTIIWGKHKGHKGRSRNILVILLWSCWDPVISFRDQSLLHPFCRCASTSTGIVSVRGAHQGSRSPVWQCGCWENARAVARLLEAGVLTSDLSLSRESSWQVIDWLGCCFWKALHDSWLLSVSICLSRVKKIVGFTVWCKIALNCTCI